MTVKEFELLALDGHNYPTWAVDVKVSLASRGLYRAVLPPKEGVAPLDDQHVYTALYLVRSHIHPDLKAEYLLEKIHEIYGTLLGNAMNNKRHLSCLRPTMSGHNFTYRISKQ
jgi:hypothetical protein